MVKFCLVHNIPRLFTTTSTLRKLDLTNCLLCIYNDHTLSFLLTVIANLYQYKDRDTDKEKDGDEEIETDSTMGEYIMSRRYASLLGACLQVK